MTDRIRALSQLVRLPALFTAWSNILAAHLIATQGIVQWHALGLLLIATSGLYLGGMVLNDCFDVNVDRRERPQRPLPSGRIAVRSAWLLGFSLLALGVLAAGILGTLQLLIALLLAAAILAYDGWLKSNPAGPVAMGACRYLNWLLGLSVAPLDMAAWVLPVPIFLYILSVTILSRGETGASSRSPQIWCLYGLVFTACGLAALFGGGILSQAWALIPAVLLLGLLIGTLVKNFNTPTPEQTQHSVKVLLLGVIPLDALLVMGAGLEWEALAVLELLIPGRLLAGLIYVT